MLDRAGAERGNAPEQLSTLPRRQRPLGRRLWLVALVAVTASLAACWIAYRVLLPTPVHRAATQRPADRAPVGEGEHSRLLLAAGVDVTADRLLELTAIDSAEIESRLDALASDIEPANDWRPVFDRLRHEHPADADAVLAAYRQSIARARRFLGETPLVGLPPDGPQLVAMPRSPFGWYLPFAVYVKGRLSIVVPPAALVGDAGEQLVGQRGVNEATDGLRTHCQVCILPLVVHEVFPGHHVAWWHRRPVVGEAQAKAEEAGYDDLMQEGWALYSELLMLERGLYRTPEERLAAWRLLLLRVERARIDVELHHGALSSSEARAFYVQRLLVTPQSADAEVARALRYPGLQTSYYIGLLRLLAMRNDWRQQHDKDRAFELHQQLLEPPQSLTAAAQRLGLEIGESKPLRDLLLD